jgi:RNA polymerase sigma-70 factor (ECF subfamily)
LQEPSKRARFEEVILPHLGAAYNLARWLTGDDHDAADVLQEAFLRAFRGFDGYRGGDGRSWLLAVVRNTCHTWLKKRARDSTASYDDETHGPSDAFNPETLLLRKASVELVRAALEELPPVFREILVLREMEGCSYKEIADVLDVPLGTVMSRLTRARVRLQQCLTGRLSEESRP